MAARCVGLILLCLASLFLIGCARTRDLSESFNPDPRQESRAVEAVETLRVLYNGHACKTIYAQASEAFRSQPLWDWQYHCDRMKEIVGRWESSKEEDVFLSPNVVEVITSGLFAGRPYAFVSYWEIPVSTRSLRLLGYEVDQANGEFVAGFPQDSLRGLYDTWPPQYKRKIGRDG